MIATGLFLAALGACSSSSSQTASSQTAPAATTTASSARRAPRAIVLKTKFAITGAYTLNGTFADRVTPYSISRAAISCASYAQTGAVTSGQANVIFAISGPLDTKLPVAGHTLGWNIWAQPAGGYQGPGTVTSNTDINVQVIIDGTAYFGDNAQSQRYVVNTDGSGSYHAVGLASAGVPKINADYSWTCSDQ